MIIFLFLLAFVPLVYAIPTSKQRRQARMRKRASRDALQVEIRFIPKMTADASEIVNTEGVLREMKIECAAYQLAFNKPLLNVPHVLLLKSPENRLNSMIKMFDGWGVRKETEFRYLKERTAIFNFLQDLLSNINEDVLAVEFSSQRIGLLWGEKDDSEAVYLELVEVLKKLKTLTEETELIYDSE